jgi:uncharacterized protein YceK
MKKFIYFLLIILLLSIALSGCSNNESNTGPAAKAAKSYYLKEYYNDSSYIEEIKIVDVKIEEDHAIVKAKIRYEEGAPSYKQENCKVYLEKYGNDWEVQFCL